MENLISLIIDLLTALLSGSKNEKQDSSPPVNRPDPSRPRPQPQLRSTSWEDELRRLLEGQAPPQAAPPPQRTPPTISPQTLRAITVRTLPAAVTNPAPVYPGRERPILSTPPLPPGVEITSQQLAPMNESKQAYARASQLDQTAAARIERIPGQHVQLTAVVRRAASPEVVQVVSMFKNSRAARQAVIASVILGPPRSLEEQTAANF
jgi:hypothetical protein